MNLQIFIEISGLSLSLLFLFFLIKENIWCWFFGILGSLLSIYLFISAKLYSEAFLHSYYIVAGIYGWWMWSNRSGSPTKIKEWGPIGHAIAIFVGTGLSLGLGYLMKNNTDANNPLEDAFSTIFSFIATFMETNKVLSGWVYWFLINGFSIWLYSQRDLYVYAGKMGIFTIFSVVGFLAWYKKYKQETQPA